MLRKLCLCAIGLVFATVAFSQTPRKTTLAVMDLAATGISQSDGAILTDALLSYLVNTNYYEIVERSKRDEILKEQGFALSGACSETSCLLEIGKYLSVQKMIGGSIGKLGGTWTVNIRLLDINTGKVEKACMKYYKGEIDQMLGYMNDIAQEIIQASGPTKEQIEAMRQKAVADSAAAAQAEQSRQAAKRQAELEASRKAQAELARKKFVADSLAAEARRTKLKMPVLTYSTLGGTVILAGLTYLYYTSAQDSYDKYIAATTAEDAATYRDEAESKDNAAAICSYAAIGVGAVNIVSWFLRKKAHPELSRQSAVELTPSLSCKRGSKGELNAALTWRF